MAVSIDLEENPSFFQSSCPGNLRLEEDKLKNLSPQSLDLATARGGFTCCVPGCFSNSKKDKALSFYRIPKDKKLRKAWLHKISRKDFRPTDGHRVCSDHFVGGKKTYMNNIPLVVPRTLKAAQSKPRQTMASLGIRGELFVDDKPHVEIQERSQECGTDSQTSSYLEEIFFLKRKILDMEACHQNEIDMLQQEIRELKKNRFSIENAKENKEMLHFYTGLPDYDTFEILFNYLGPAVKYLAYFGSNTAGEKINSETYVKRGPKRALSPQQELFIVVSRLRCDLLEKDLAFRLGISVAHVSRICATWIDFLHSRFRALPIWAPRQTVDETMPECFKESYPNTRVIVDCTELFIEQPSSLRSQSITYSSYKHHNTAKGLIGIAPSAAVTFVSDLFAGRVSDRKATKMSGLYKLLQAGDSIMADRGFDLDSDLPPGVNLNIPAFMNGRDQLDILDETETRRIASVRIHVERAIARIKSFRILKTTFPISMASDLNKIWVICCYLINFLPPIVVEKKHSE